MINVTAYFLRIMKLICHTLHMLLICFLLLIVGCNETDEIIETGHITVTGYQCFAFNQENQTRTTPETDSPLKDGCRISFYIKGETNSETSLELKNGIWTGNLPELNPGSNSPYNIVALYPEQTADFSFYNTEGQLVDVCYNEQEIDSKNITLQFKHLFSKLTIELSETLQNKLQQLTVTPQQKIAGVNRFPITLQYNTENPHTISFQKGDQREYSLLVPPHESQTCVITITTTEGEVFTTKLENKHMKSGILYLCRIQSKEDGKGIQTAEDLIDFSNLINGIPVKGRKLEDFYTLKNGRRVFKLLNDITLVPEQSERILTICNSGQNKFNDIFDGNYHSITGFSREDASFSYGSLFGYISNTAILENLIIKNVTIKQIKRTGEFGILCKENEGIIRNCKIYNVKITTDPNTDVDVGGISCKNPGKIYNCQIYNMEILNPKKSNFCSGGITGRNTGYVINCNVHLPKIDGKGLKSGICAIAEKYQANCLVYDPGITSYSNYGSLICHSYNPNRCEHSFWLSREYKKSVYKVFGGTITDCNPFTLENAPETVERLNNWIRTTGKERFPDLEFKEWKLDEKGVPILKD